MGRCHFEGVDLVWDKVDLAWDKVQCIVSLCASVSKRFYDDSFV